MIELQCRSNKMVVFGTRATALWSSTCMSQLELGNIRLSSRPSGEALSLRAIPSVWIEVSHEGEH